MRVVSEQYIEGGVIKTRRVTAILDVNTELDYETIKKGYLRSGYGYEIDVDANVRFSIGGSNVSQTSSLHKALMNRCTEAQLAYAYVPHLKNPYKTPVELVGGSGHFTFEKNTEQSVYNNPKQFIPVWWADTPKNKENYTVKSYATAVYTPAGMLTAWGDDQSITISGSMYDDDTVLIQ